MNGMNTIAMLDNKSCRTSNVWLYKISMKVSHVQDAMRKLTEPAVRWDLFFA